jgi:hypothetical protein
MKLKDLPVVVLIVLTLPLAACGAAPAEAAPPDTAVTVVPIDGSELSAVVLSEKAIDRLGIETTAVRAGTDGGTVVPYAAVLYDETGGTWVFTNPKGLEYLRAPIVVDTIVGDDARLTQGPPVGTRVVTVGVAELYGAEQGVGDPE